MQTIQGKIIKFIPRTEGDSQSGKHWVKAGIVIEYGDEYPTKAAFSVFGEGRLQQCAGLKEGMEVIVTYNPQSREYNGRWYTDLQCINVMTVPQQQPAQQPAQPQQPQYPYAQQQMPAQPTAQVMPTEDPDLPF